MIELFWNLIWKKILKKEQERKKKNDGDAAAAAAAALSLVQLSVSQNESTFRKGFTLE